MSISDRLRELEARARRQENRPTTLAQAQPGHLAMVIDAVDWDGEPVRVEVMYVDRPIRCDPNDD